MKPSPAMTAPLLLRLSGIGKSFGPVRVLDDVSFDLRAGEVHVLAGENGAGKSTLIKILAGIHTEYEGTIELAGSIFRFAEPRESRQAGVAVIHQELSLVDSMSVLDNLFLGREPSRLWGWWLDAGAERARARELCRQLNLDLSDRDLSAPAGLLSLSNKNRIEIAKATAFESRVFVMDEPTSALDKPDVDQLFALIDRLKANGCGIIFISHRMEEIYRIADRITVLRDGKKIGTAAAADCPEPTLVQWMAGREMSASLGARNSRPARSARPPRLELKGLRIKNRFGRDAVRGLTLSVEAGEIVGIAGLQGSGNTECFQGVFGERGLAGDGLIQLDGEPFRPRNPADSIRRGIAHLTADRKATGLVLGMSVEANVSLASLPRFSPGGWIRRRDERESARRWEKALRIRLASPDQAVGTLSGGNQQKVVMAKWLEIRPKVLLLEEPTRGVDVEAKREIHSLMRQWTAEGMAILLISSELPELLSLSDRIVVLHRGEVAAEFDAADASQENILAAAMGSS